MNMPITDFVNKITFLGQLHAGRRSAWHRHRLASACSVLLCQQQQSPNSPSNLYLHLGSQLVPKEGSCKDPYLEHIA